jgi:hypothetical protein
MPGRAIAALRGETVHEGLLQRVQRRALASPAAVSTARPRPPRPAQAGQLRRAVDQHGAGPAGALPAAVFGRQVAHPAAQEVEQVLPVLGKGRLGAPLRVKVTGFIAISRHPFQKPPQMHARHLAPVPPRGERVGRRVEPSAPPARRGRWWRRPAPAPPAPARPLAARRGRGPIAPKATRTPRCAPSRGRCAAIDSTETPLRLDPADLEPAEGARIARARHLDRRRPRPGRRGRAAGPPAAGHRPGHDRPRAQRQQRHGEIAIGMRARTGCRRPSPWPAPAARRPRARRDAGRQGRGGQRSAPWSRRRRAGRRRPSRGSARSAGSVARTMRPCTVPALTSRITPVPPPR